jgi:uncharacterized lipoprotein YmbA
MTRKVLLLLSALAVTASGCAGAPTRFYTVEAMAPSGAIHAGYAGAAYRIDAVHIPADLDRPELVRPASGGRFTVSDNDHWAAPLGELIQRALTQDLAAQFPSGKIIYPDAPKPAGAGGVVVTILDVSYAGGQAVMDASWTLLAPRSTATAPAVVAPIGPRTVRVTAPARTAGVTGDAAALSALSSRLAEAIAADLDASAAQ